MSKSSSLFPPPRAASSAQGVRYQDHIGSPSRSDKTAQRILSQSTRVHVLRDKIEPEYARELELLAQQLGAQVTSLPAPANVVVTVLKAPKRVLKHFNDGLVNVVPFKPVTTGRDDGEREGEVDTELGQGVARDWRRFVVTPEWLDAVKARGTLVDPDEFPAVAVKEDQVQQSCEGQVEARGSGERKRKRSPSDSPLLPTQHATRPRLKTRSSTSSSSSSLSSPSSVAASRQTTESMSAAEMSSYYGPIDHPPGVPRWTNTRFACRRPSPLVSVNQALISSLELIRNERRLTGDTYSEMAYMRAISALKAFPFRIPHPTLDPPSIFDSSLLELRLSEVEKLKGVGRKVYSLIRQFFTEGRIVEAKVIARDRAVYGMNAFAELYGIGPIGAREAWNAGARSFRDVLNRGKSLATHLSARESVRILGDLRKPIGREECRAITRDIMQMIRSVLPEEIEVRHEICGGYRRGKERTFDVDVIIGHGEAASRALHMRLLDEMKKKGLITHIVGVTTPAPSFLDPSDPSTKQKGQADETIHIDIANIVVLPPLSATNPTPIHRRVDLVFCPLRVYGATVLGWTGSMTFERDLRLWAQTKGFKFSFDGLTNLAEEVVVETRDERQLFDILGLEWMPPEWRNCDA